MLAPLIAWAAAWDAALPHGESPALWYIVWPFFAFPGLAGLWHIALVIREKHRFAYIVYAIVFMPLLYYVCVFGIVAAIHFPL
jgi:hypothetical protein